MIDCLMHYRGVGSEQRRLPAMPAVGSYLEHDGGLWVVDTLVSSGDTVDVYCNQVGGERTSELRQAWVDWATTPLAAEPEPAAQQTLFGRDAA